MRDEHMSLAESELTAIGAMTRMYSLLTDILGSLSPACQILLGAMQPDCEPPF